MKWARNHGSSIERADRTDPEKMIGKMAATHAANKMMALNPLIGKYQLSNQKNVTPIQAMVDRACAKPKTKPC